MPTSKDLNDLDSQLKKSLISPESFKRGLSMDPSKNIIGVHKTVGTLARHTRKLVIRVNNLEKTVNNQAKKITSLKNISKNQSTRISGANIGAKLPGGKANDVNENIKAITNSLTSIAQILAGGKKLKSDTAAFDRRKAEQEKRALAESKLEKRFDGLKKIAEKIIAPVKNILDRIIDFLVKVFLGRVIFKLIEWFGDPKNASKVKSIIRFIGDFWPALLSAYILFGTSFGGLIRFTLGWVARLSLQIGRVAIPALLRLVAANPVASLVIGGAAAAGVGAYAASRQNEQKREGVKPGEGTPNASQLQREQTLQRGLGGMFAGGGFVIPKFFGGGANAGYVSGEKGVDKVPAMLTDGEFVMSAGAVQTWGLDTLEAMNAAGGGTNKPKVIRGTTFAQGGGSIGQIGDDRKRFIDIYNYFASQGIDPGDPKTYGGRGGNVGGGFKMPGGGFKMPNISGINIPSEFGGGTIGDLGKQASAGVTKLKESTSGIQKYIQDTINKVKSDPRVQNVGKAVSEIQKKLIKNGYLNEEGKLSGAAKNQATNFLSDLLPNLPFVNAMNKMKTESYLKSIGISKENAKYGDLAAQAMITGKSGVESAYNIGKMQLNKMSKESKKIYLDTLKERMASGTLKSGDLINPYGKVDKSDPRYREQGTVRFYVDPKTGKGYLLDTYGFDPGKVNLGGPGSAAQKQYEDQVKSFQDPKKKIKLGPLDIPIGQIAKKLNLKPMQDATEGGGLPQYILALRNKLFGYDAQKEGSSLDPKRFKTKAQIDELSELGDLKKFAAKQLTPAQRKLVDEKLKKAEIADKRKREEQKLGGGSVKLYDKPQKNTGQSYKSRFARPKNAGVKPVAPPVKPKPKVTVIQKPKRNVRGGGSGGGNGSTVPNIQIPPQDRNKARTQGR